MLLVLNGAMQTIKTLRKHYSKHMPQLPLRNRVLKESESLTFPASQNIHCGVVMAAKSLETT